jgi:hypothetical protein
LTAINLTLPHAIHDGALNAGLRFARAVIQAAGTWHINRVAQTGVAWHAARKDAAHVIAVILLNQVEAVAEAKATGSCGNNATGVHACVGTFEIRSATFFTLVLS